jgi:hypothetical protein
LPDLVAFSIESAAGAARPGTAQRPTGVVLDAAIGVYSGKGTGELSLLRSIWDQLQQSVYPNDGWLDIDNNDGENSLRGLCIGRRNWLFCGSDRGGRAAAIHFSLRASCKRHGHDPWAYLRDVLTRLPAMLPGASEEELLGLLPHRWKPA